MAHKANRDYFVVDSESLELLRDEVGTGEVRELRPQDAGLVLSHLASHPETVYIAASGVPPTNHVGFFHHTESQLAIEWTRHETSPSPGEPELNTYRYNLGYGMDGKAYGFKNANADSPTNGQVGDHWMDLETAAERYPADPKRREVGE